MTGSRLTKALGGLRTSDPAYGGYPTRIPFPRFLHIILLFSFLYISHFVSTFGEAGSSRNKKAANKKSKLHPRARARARTCTHSMVISFIDPLYHAWSRKNDKFSRQQNRDTRAHARRSNTICTYIYKNRARRKYSSRHLRSLNRAPDLNSPFRICSYLPGPELSGRI